MRARTYCNAISKKLMWMNILQLELCESSREWAKAAILQFGSPLQKIKVSVFGVPGLLGGVVATGAAQGGSFYLEFDQCPCFELEMNFQHMNRMRFRMCFGRNTAKKKKNRCGSVAEARAELPPADVVGFGSLTFDIHRFSVGAM